MKIYKANIKINDCLKVFAFRNKYSLRANDLVRKIFDRIKNDRMGEFGEEDIWVEIRRQKIPHSTFENFYVDANTKNDKIYLVIFLDHGFSEKDYQKLNFVLYEIIRHELEHVGKFSMDKKPDGKYVQLYYDLRNNNDIHDHVRMISQYILSDTEIDSYAKSIMYVAKKQNKSVLEIVDQVIKRAFFGNDSKIMVEVMQNKEMKNIVEYTKNKLKEKIKEYFPTFKETWR